MRHLRFAATATCAVLCGLLTACAGGSPAPVAGPAIATVPAPAVSSSTEPSSPPSMKTAPTSSLCEALDLPAAQAVSASLRAVPRAAANQGTENDACGYAMADGSALLTLAPATRPYDQELALARTLVRDPASSGMRDVRVTEVAGIGQAAFSENGFVVQQQQNVAYVVWRSGSRSWVLTLSETAHTGNSDRLGAVAKQIDPRLPR
ncbi:hypothetical protein UK23_10750 [Lentzea aerocolonigenes]|uniref:DUF3558 domain-containing protein n=1 Tax=Lentzea aerocolonigenes TaxID=68170 RepID=A0A0F0H420_LENAE|nr:hypothetical protein [Lentzea aerocolonigenes]KJK50459.1 hypothetical protein UK23_10750 [Lentzea aerocolonigenes]